MHEALSENLNGVHYDVGLKSRYYVGKCVVMQFGGVESKMYNNLTETYIFLLISFFRISMLKFKVEMVTAYWLRIKF